MTSTDERRAVLITGGASGLGARLAERFAGEGWYVGVLDRRPSLPDELEEIRRAGSLALTVGDVTDPEAYTESVEGLTAVAGGVDAVVANAGIWDFNRALLDMDPLALSESFDQLFSVNVKGYLMAARCTAEALARRRGSLVLTLSNAALYPGGGGPLYTASKHAGVGIVRQLAYELAPAVRVNAVAPAGMSTQLAGPTGLGLDGARIDDDYDGETFASRVPLGFAPSVDDYVDAYLYLADGARSRAVTGIVLPVELGMGVRGLRNIAGGVREEG